MHRTGRTGRAGKTGIAISLIAPRELGNFYMLKLTYKIKPEERTLPSESEWKSVREAAQVEALKNQIDQAGARAPSVEWIAVAKRLWTSEDGERYVAALIQDRLQPERRRVSDPDPTVTAIPSAPAIAPSPALPGPAAVARDGSVIAREPRGEGEPRAAAPREGEREALNPARRRRRGRGREESRGRDRDRAPRRENGASAPRSEPQAPRSSPVGGTIDDSDGREFWEAWVDSKSEAPGTPAAAAGGTERAERTERAEAPRAPRPPREPREPREPERPLEPGQVRLYLNLGRRDGLREPEIAQLLSDRGVGGVETQVRNSHTYLIAAESNEAAICAALTGQKHGEREIVCERARR